MSSVARVTSTFRLRRSRFITPRRILGRRRQICLIRDGEQLLLVLQPRGENLYLWWRDRFHHENSTTDVDEYNTRTETWTPKKKLQRPLHNFSASFVNSGMIYVMGGQKWKGKGGVDGGANDPDWTFYDDVWEYSPEKDDWKRVERMPKAKSSFGSAVANGKIYIVAGWAGGAGDENGVHVYQPPGWPFPAKFSVEPQNKLATIWGELKRHQ